MDIRELAENIIDRIRDEAEGSIQERLDALDNYDDVYDYIHDEVRDVYYTDDMKDLLDEIDVLNDVIENAFDDYQCEIEEAVRNELDSLLDDFRDELNEEAKDYQQTYKQSVEYIIKELNVLSAVVKNLEGFEGLELSEEKKKALSMAVSMLEVLNNEEGTSEEVINDED